MLIPSIDLMGGQVVQLVQGRRDRTAVASDDIDAWVRRFQRFPRVQLIDLDAALGSGTNDALVRTIAPRLPCRVGGGIRTADRAREVLGYGARAVIVGSSLFRSGRPHTGFGAGPGRAGRTPAAPRRSPAPSAPSTSSRRWTAGAGGSS